MRTREEFWGAVSVGPSHACWPWKKARNNTGYGTVWWGNKCFTAHRVAAFLSGIVSNPAAPKRKGDSTHVLHKCDNRACCNPTHFFLGNYSDNQLDCYRKGRSNRAKGSDHKNARLTPTQVQEIRILRREGVKQQYLATKFGVGQTTISGIVLGKTYK